MLIIYLQTLFKLAGRSAAVDKKKQKNKTKQEKTEFVQAGGETMIDVLTEICNRIWRTGE